MLFSENIALLIDRFHAWNSPPLCFSKFLYEKQKEAFPSVFPEGLILIREP